MTTIFFKRYDSEFEPGIKVSKAWVGYRSMKSLDGATQVLGPLCQTFVG